MNISYFFSSPSGDIPVLPDELKGPFLVSAAEHHETLSLGDYFETIKDFILLDNEKALRKALQALPSNSNTLDLNNSEIKIRSEKHGALYHIASIEIARQNTSVKFAVSTAITEKGKNCLQRDHTIISRLNGFHGLPYLPQTFDMRHMPCGHNEYQTDALLVLSEWFEDFHEWHLAVDKQTGDKGICLWDHVRGNRFLSQNAASEIFKQIAEILTLYYDPESYNQIFPWHHAAGDFIVRNNNDAVAVRLTTARGYDPVLSFSREDANAPLAALISFFLHLTLWMRLDKLDGVGKTVWFDNYVVHAATKGFFDAFATMEAKGKINFCSPTDFLSLMQSFGEEELLALFQPILESYSEITSATDLSMIQKQLKEHTRQLHKILTAYSPQQLTR